MAVVQKFPKWKYHRTEKPVIVPTVEHESALGAGWEDTPAAFTAAPPSEPTVEPEPPPPSPAESTDAGQAKGRAKGKGKAPEQPE